ncbi:MAG: hypothetical protein IPP72_14490 [Chitinophagaceae bacterium]|nr:hypothetical protein [Chitinophagaceae bacterium]
MKRLLLLLPSLVLFILQVNSKILDPNAGKQHPILKSVAPSLDKVMDVVQDNNSVISAGKRADTCTAG